MMGRQPNYQHKLFVTGFNLNNRIRNDHPLRKIQEKIDFHFIYGEVEDTYGSNGNVSVPPPCHSQNVASPYSLQCEV